MLVKGLFSSLNVHVTIENDLNFQLRKIKLMNLALQGVCSSY